MSIPVKVFTGKKALIENLSPQTVINNWIINYEVVEIPVSPTDKYDDLLRKCGINCHITPCHLPMFALWNTTTQSWMKLNDTININSTAYRNNHEVQLEFRVRFVVKTEMKVGEIRKRAHRCGLIGDGTTPVMDDNVIGYFFRQRREDFLLDNIKFSVEERSENEILSAALGVAVLDMFCIAKVANMSLSAARTRVKFKQLLPQSCRDQMSSFNLFNKLRVKNKFKQFMAHFTPSAQNWQQNGRNLAFFQERYLLNLELYSATFGVEDYILAEGGTVSISADSGIVYSNETDDIAEKWCDISEVTNMSMQVRNPPEIQQSNEPNRFIISLGKFDGHVKEFTMKSVSNAENFASCIEGYHHMLADAHHYLCKEVTSPSLIERLQLNCHGPINCSFAVDLLQNRENLQVGDCVLRQSQEAYDEYFVNVVCQIMPLDIRNFKMDRNASGYLGLLGLVRSHVHNSLREMLDACKDGYYNQNTILFNPEKTIFPKAKHKSNLIIRLCSNNNSDEYDHPDIHDIKPNFALLRLEDYQSVVLLGNGVFSNVRRYTRREGVDNHVVFKIVHEQRDDEALDHHINRAFQRSTEMLNRLNHQHIIRHLGMSLNNMVALEYLRFGSITSYLQGNLRRSGTEWPSWFLQVLWQITHACHYLEELGFTHGNLCGKNILLQKDFPQPYIKLADPGVTTRTATLGRRQIVEPILTAPWLSYEFCCVDSTPLHWDRYPTIEGDKWSFATTLCEILNWGRIAVEPMNAYRMTPELRDCYKSGGLLNRLPELITANEGLCQLICKCWSSDSRDRPPFQQILREIGSTLKSDYVFLAMSAGPVNATMIELEHGLPTYEDEKLTFHGSLGEGHFGRVDLFAYDQYRNGITEMVAVKKSKRSTSQQQQEFNQEIETMRRLKHPYVVRLLGIADPSGRIVMEYLVKGSLADELKKRKRSNNKLHTSILLGYSSQIAEGMIALQQMRLIHRDLALRNILLGNDDGNLHIKISDFGLSRFLSEDSNYYSGNSKDFPPLWYAPECLCRDPKITFLFESDVWSYGVTIWEMFSHGERPVYPNPDISQINEAKLPMFKEYLKQGHRLPKTEDCPSGVYNIMQRCWVFEPKNRLKFQDIQNEFDSLIQEINSA